jgi:hypothetical protein
MVQNIRQHSIHNKGMSSIKIREKILHQQRERHINHANNLAGIHNFRDWCCHLAKKKN